MDGERIKELRELWKAGFASASPRVQAVYDAFPEALTALRDVTAERDELRGLVADLRDWHCHTDEDANEIFERVAEAFHADTGMLRPGKSQSPEAYHSDEDRRQAFYGWAKAKHDALTARIVAALEDR